MNRSQIQAFVAELGVDPKVVSSVTFHPSGIDVEQARWDVLRDGPVWGADGAVATFVSTFPYPPED